MYRFYRYILFVVIVAFISGCGSKDNKDTNNSINSSATSLSTIKIGVIPYDKVETVQQAYKPFAAYISKKTGCKDGQVFVTPDYSGILQALRSDQIDCAYLNPLSYVLAVDQFKDTPEHLIPIAMPYYKNSLTYRGDIFVRVDSGIKSMKDFKGRSFAFADRTSTSGYLYPAGLMLEAGVDPAKDVKAVNISGGGSTMAVFNKVADGGASYEGAIDRAFKDHPDQAKQMMVIAKTDPIPNGMFVVRGNLDPKLIEALKKAMNDINTDPEGKVPLDKMEFTKWVPADDSEFDSVRKKAKILNLNLHSLDKPKAK